MVDGCGNGWEGVGEGGDDGRCRRGIVDDPVHRERVCLQFVYLQLINNNIYKGTYSI